VAGEPVRFGTVADMRAMIAHAGYPYKRYRVTTLDGYILTLERVCLFAFRFF
jgi:hypothetical protein